jgi:hypothetical protein
MKTAYATLTVTFLAGAVIAFAVSLWMIHVSPGLPLGQVLIEVTTSGDLMFDGAEIVLVALATGLAVLVKAGRVRRLMGLVLWAAGLVTVIYAAIHAGDIFRRIEAVTRRLGHLDFVIRAPGYADVLMILAGGLLAGAVAFGALFWLRTRRV